MANNRFRPKPGRFGVMTEHSAATVASGTNSLTANGTTTYYVPPTYRLKRVARMTVSATTVPVDSDGTMLATFYKVVAGTTSTALSSAFDLSTLTALVSNKFTVTTTEADRFVQEGDTVKVAIVNNSAAIDTQPVDLKFTIEWEVIQ